MVSIVVITILLLFYIYKFNKIYLHDFRDTENSLLQNLKDVLEVDFPARTVLEKSVSIFHFFDTQKNSTIV